ncbi:GNAT family N-acetyltransferase [Arthrobacter livingstonensis]|uniref:GNAT family N-acetyltransferase n=2 Tax=Arthrobacter livingstonensis TaxID=670078 RepID=A0A2V5LZB4_9MICC|nr:GNAT family N-acetyltransferase [Arthrobacter livingstonensis]
MFARKPTLQGTRCVLRPFSPEDLPALGGILADPEVLRLTGSVHSSAAAAAASPVLDAATREWYLSRNARTDRLDLAIVDAAGGECVGEVVLNELRGDDSCNFRILVGPRGRGRGIGSEATRMMLDYAFSATTLNRIELEVFGFNPRARHVYGKAGFVLEGWKRAALKFDGRYVDSAMMAVLRGDWDAIHGPQV